MIHAHIAHEQAVIMDLRRRLGVERNRDLQFLQIRRRDGEDPLSGRARDSGHFFRVGRNQEAIPVTALALSAPLIEGTACITGGELVVTRRGTIRKQPVFPSSR